MKDILFAIAVFGMVLFFLWRANGKGYRAGYSDGVKDCLNDRARIELKTDTIISPRP